MNKEKKRYPVSLILIGLVRDLVKGAFFLLLAFALLLTGGVDKKIFTMAGLAILASVLVVCFVHQLLRRVVFLYDEEADPAAWQESALERYYQRRNARAAARQAKKNAQQAAETPAEPVPAEPVPAEPVPVEPVPAEPVPVEPVPAEPVPVEPVPVESAAEEPEQPADSSVAPNADV